MITALHAEQGPHAGAVWDSQPVQAGSGLQQCCMIVPYSNWQGPIWINANYMNYIALKRYGFDEEAAELAGILGRMVLADIRKWGSMHENYDAETGEGLAPTPEQSPNHVFAGFVGWNLLVAGHAAMRGKERMRLPAELWN